MIQDSFMVIVMRTLDASFDSKLYEYYLSVASC